MSLTSFPCDSITATLKIVSHNTFYTNCHLLSVQCFMLAFKASQHLSGVIIPGQNGPFSVWTWH